MTYEELSAGLGINRSAVADAISRGMPADSIESAKIWRLSHVQKGAPGNRAKLYRKKKEKELGDKMVPPSLVVEHVPHPFIAEQVNQGTVPLDADMSLEAVLERAKRSEWLASFALERAAQRNDIELFKPLTDNHARSVKARLDAEQGVIEMQKSRGELLTLDDAMQKWGGIANTIRMLLDSLPKSVGPRCNPSDPDLAIAALEDWKNNQALKALNG